MPALSDFSLTSLHGAPMPLADYVGKVVLIVNVASQCGLTPQYTGLETLWREYRDRGLVVIGCPCNQFGAQEPGTSDEIATFCSTTYDVTFPLSAKLDVNGAGTDPLWQWLKEEQPGILGTEAIKWNFTKFLVGRDGQTRKRFAPTDTPDSLRSAIEAALAA